MYKPASCCQFNVSVSQDDTECVVSVCATHRVGQTLEGRQVEALDWLARKYTLLFIEIFQVRNSVTYAKNIPAIGL